MEFKVFCEKVANTLGVELMKVMGDQASTYAATPTMPNPNYFVDFYSFNIDEREDYLAEVYADIYGHKRVLVGYIGWEKLPGKVGKAEHWECQVSPIGHYDDKFMPIDENGKSVDGELWQYYYGRSVERAAESILQGGALTNPNRRPIRVW